MDVVQVPDWQFKVALSEAQALRKQVAEACSAPSELPSEADYWLTDDGLSGFGVANGELIGVFSTLKGRGDSLLTLAIEKGAKHLDCFDGYLPSFYEGHGFREVKRVPNWTVNGPDVVYMALKSQER